MNANWIQLAEPGSFLTEEQNGVSSRKRGLEELYGTSDFFKTLLELLSSHFSSDKYRHGLSTQTEEKVRSGYAGMVSPLIAA